jgi:hypothetical protein
MQFKDKFGVSPEEFKELARRLPAYCFKVAVQNSFMLATDEEADPLEMQRYRLLEEVMLERRDL